MCVSKEYVVLLPSLCKTRGKKCSNCNIEHVFSKLSGFNTSKKESRKKQRHR